MKRILPALGLAFVLLTLLSEPALAGGNHRGFSGGAHLRPGNTFPAHGHLAFRPRVHSFRPRAHRPFFRHRAHRPLFAHPRFRPRVRVFIAPKRTWVARGWRWNGFGWVWVPGSWSK